MARRRRPWDATDDPGSPVVRFPPPTDGPESSGDHHVRLHLRTVTEARGDGRSRTPAGDRTRTRTGTRALLVSGTVIAVIVASAVLGAGVIGLDDHASTPYASPPGTSTPPTVTASTGVAPAEPGGTPASVPSATTVPAVSREPEAGHVAIPSTPPSATTPSTDGTAIGHTGSSTDRASVPISYASTAPAPPSADIPPSPDPSIPCRSPDDQDACIADTVLAIDNARAQEGVGPLVLPPDFDGLTPPEQLFVMVDCERVDRGLAPIAGELGTLDQLSTTAAQDETDPSVPPGGVADLAVQAWVGNWASTESTVQAVYDWMYDDGLGSGNIDCTATDESGCWDHRDNILGLGNDLDSFGGSLSFGGADVSTGSTSTTAMQDQPGESVTMLTAWSTESPSDYYYTWSQALADGAG